jgi:hypothetical protein
VVPVDKDELIRPPHDNEGFGESFFYLVDAPLEFVFVNA